MIESPDAPVRSAALRLLELQAEHAELDARIDALDANGQGADELHLRRLKKQRLALRDGMRQLQLLLTPKEPA